MRNVREIKVIRINYSKWKEVSYETKTKNFY